MILIDMGKLKSLTHTLSPTIRFAAAIVRSVGLSRDARHQQQPHKRNAPRTMGEFLRTPLLLPLAPQQQPVGNPTFKLVSLTRSQPGKEQK